MFIVNRRTVQLFTFDCSFVFSNERDSVVTFKDFKPNQRLVIFGTNVAM